MKIVPKVLASEILTQGLVKFLFLFFTIISFLICSSLFVIITFKNMYDFCYQSKVYNYCTYVMVETTLKSCCNCIKTIQAN